MAAENETVSVSFILLLTITAITRKKDEPMKNLILTFSVVFTLVAAPSLAKAAVALTYDSGEPVNIDQGNYGNIGAELTVGSSAIEVTSVAAEVTENNGAGDEQGQPNTYDTNGLSTSDFTVNFYDLGTSTLLGSYVVPTGTAVDSNGFAYVSIPTLTIAAGTDLGFTEFIGDSGDSADVVTPYGIDYGASGAITTTGTDLTYVGVLQADGSDTMGATYDPSDIPTHVDSTETVTSNFGYTVAPEPSTYALGALGLGLLLVLVRRTARKSA